MNKLSAYSILTVLLPLICVFVSGGVVFYEWHRLHQLQDDQRQTEGELTQLNKMMKDLAAQPRSAKVPTAPQTPQEQTDFLNQLREYALVSNVQLVRYATAAPAAAPAPAPAANGTPGAAPALPANVTPIASSVEAVGRFADVRSFLYALLRAPRLLNLSAVKWSREQQWPQTRVSFTLTRYVAPPRPAAAASLPVGGSS